MFMQSSIWVEICPHKSCYQVQVSTLYLRSGLFYIGTNWMILKFVQMVSTHRAGICYSQLQWRGESTRYQASSGTSHSFFFFFYMCLFLTLVPCWLLSHPLLFGLLSLWWRHPWPTTQRCLMMFAGIPNCLCSLYLVITVCMFGRWPYDTVFHLFSSKCNVNWL